MTKEWMSAEELTIPLPHIRLAAKRWGDRDKPLLLALHGWLDNADSFLPLAQYLCDYQLIAVEWPGHGLSQHRPGQYPLQWVDYLYDLEHMINYLSKSHPIAALIGHSLGGIVASAYGALFSEKIPKLILIEAFSPLFEDVGRAQQRLKNSFSEHQRLSETQDKLPHYHSIERPAAARAKLTGLAPQWCRLLTQRNMIQTDNGFVWRTDPRLKLSSPMRLSFEQVDAMMKGHSCNTLLLLGDRGYSQLVELLPQVKSWYHSCEIETMTGDHHLHMGSAKQVAQVMIQFLQK